jgi:hypothetical protein
MPPTPHFTWTALTPGTLDRCIPLWSGGANHEPSKLAQTVARVRRLLFEDRARGRIIIDERGQPRAFGVSVFVTELAAERLAKASQPLIGEQLLGDRRWNSLILDTAGIARGNARGGLQMVVVNQGYDDRQLTDEGWAILLGALIQAFIDVHQGFRLARVIIEAFGERGASFVASTWPNVVQCRVQTGHGRALRAARWAFTRVEAERQGGALLPMFNYRPPILALTSAEKDVLRVALTGATDPIIAKTLEIPLASVKGRWSRIFRRVAETPLMSIVDAEKRSGHRGPQFRHILVDYVRQNPSELTPFDRST